MAVSFKDLNRPPKQFRMVEKTGTVYRREFNQDNTYIDIDVEQESQFWKDIKSLTDIPY